MTRIFEERSEDSCPTTITKPCTTTNLDKSYNYPQHLPEPGPSYSINNSPDPSQKSNNISIVSLQDEDINSSDTASDSENNSDNNETATNIKYVVEAVNKNSLNSSIIPQNGSVILTQALAQVPSSAGPPKIGNIAVQNSSDITFGNKTFYQGPVTIKQFLLDGSNRWVVRDEKDEGYNNPNYVATSSESSLNETRTAAANGMYEIVCVY